MPESKKEAPDKEKLLTDEGEDEVVIDDTKPPKMDEGEELSEEEVAKKEDSEAPDKEKAEEEELDPELEKLMKKKGFKSPAEVAKALKDYESKNTKLEQERKLSSLLPPGEVAAEAPRRRETKPYPKLEKELIDMSGQELVDYIQQREDALKDEIYADYETAEEQKENKRIYAKINKDPEKFRRLKPIMSDLYVRHPKANFDQLYEAAEGMEEDVSKGRKEEAAKELNLTPDELDALKVIAGKTRPAHISGAGGTGADKTKKLTKEQAEKKLKDDIFGEATGLVRE